MSLNGLESPTVVEAYQTALAEAGGWFLLRYVSRDEVTLLDRGTGGVPDVRNAIENYEECSPLYGFLQYRRRKVVISYLPEDLSRLIRARTTVQFQSVLDKFSPHDTVFSLSQPSELTESALSSACLLHTASGSITSSSSSLRRRRLMEIAEDAEESPTSKPTAQTQPPAQDSRQRSFSHVSEATVVPPSVTSNAPQTPNGDVPDPTSPDNIQVSGRSPSISGDNHSERPTSSRNFRDDISYAPSEPRKSTQSARPSLRDLESAAGYKPKVKLGPRPSLDGSGRPRTAGNLTRAAEHRPVATLPAGVRSSSLRKSTPAPVRPRSQGNPVATPSSKAVPPVPPLLVPPLSTAISRPPLSPGAKSLSALSSSGTSNEKERLMKALQLRKSQMQKQKRAQAAKKSQQSTEKEKPTRDLSENKDNNGQSPEKLKYNEGTEGLSSISEHSKAASLQDQSETAPLDSKVEPVVDMVDVQHDGKPPSPVSRSTASEPDRQDGTLEEPQTTPPGPETNYIQENSDGADESKTKYGTGSPSGVRLEDDHQKAPEEIVRIPPLTAEPLVSSKHEAGATTELAATVDSQSIPLPKSPGSESQPGSATESSTVTVSYAAESQDAPVPEVLSVDQQSTTTRKDKRKPVLEPIQVPTPDYSDDDNLLSDDSFMEELKSATVEEAKPISVGKTPLSPGYSNVGNGKVTTDAWRNSRAVSNPSAIGHQYPSAATVTANRSISTSLPPVEISTGTVLVAKKINVSSGISKRIKALEKFSNSRDAANPTQTMPTSNASSFESLRKLASVSLAGGNVDKPLSRQPSYARETFSRASSLTRHDSQTSTNAEQTANSVSVTARIVRDENADPVESITDLTESRALNLQASPLTVERKTPDLAPSQNLSPEATPDKSAQRSMSTSSAGSAYKTPPATMPRSESRLSVSSRNDGSLLARSPSEVSVSSPEEKKESRTSRLLRRMSSLTSSSRRGTVSSRNPAVKAEENMPAVDEGSQKAKELPAAIDIGEVNVQFPDTLLWKRRFIRIDSKGYLVLTPGTVDSSNRNMVKRYHLTEFRTPCLPDEDRQELPNSILLDFLDGSTLQCACESRQGQLFILQTLVKAYSTHQQLLSR